ncbi:hypothetical protein D3C72_2275510 [compost metagenome]
MGEAVAGTAAGATLLEYVMSNSRDNCRMKASTCGDWISRPFCSTANVALP